MERKDVGNSDSGNEYAEKSHSGRAGVWDRGRARKQGGIPTLLGPGLETRCLPGLGDRGRGQPIVTGDANGGCPKVTRAARVQRAWRGGWVRAARRHVSQGRVPVCAVKGGERQSWEVLWAVLGDLERVLGEGV